MVMALCLGDIRKLFFLFCIKYNLGNEIQDSNGASVRAIRGRFIRWKESFEAKLTLDSPYTVPDSWSLIELYICELPAELICYP